MRLLESSSLVAHIAPLHIIECNIPTIPRQTHLLLKELVQSSRRIGIHLWVDFADGVNGGRICRVKCPCKCEANVIDDFNNHQLADVSVWLKVGAGGGRGGRVRFPVSRGAQT